MKDTDRKFLVEWGGEKWHEIVIEYPYEKLYQDEFYSVCKTCRCEYNESHDNRTFDTWNDFGWLWEKMNKIPTTGAFLGWLGWWRDTDWADWETKGPELRCQLICDFLREREA
jgi:hypothetical protein